MRRTRPHFVATMLAAAALALGFGGIATAQDAPVRKTIKLLDTLSYTQQPINFGIEKGFFDEEGLDVEFVAAQDTVGAVATNELTFAFGPTSTFLRAAALGAPIKIIASAFRNKGAFWLIAKPEIKTIADLKGKTVGIAQEGSGMAVYARVILQKSGIDPDKDVTLFANGTQAQAYGTLTEGQVDATIIHQPFAALGELEGKAHVLARGWEFLPTYHTGVLIAGDDVIANDPELLERGLRAYFKSYEYAKAHYDEYIPWLQARLKLNPDAVRQAVEQEDDIWEDNPDVDPVAIADTQQIEIEQGNQDAPYDATKYIDLRFIPKDYVKAFSYPADKSQG